MVEVLKEAMEPIEYGGDSEHAPEVHYPTEEEIADVLIAVWIGDVSKWKAYAKVHRIVITKDDKIKQLYSDEKVDKIVSERAEYKHRAEVAARALDLYLKREKNMRCWHYLTYDRNCDRNCEECWEGYFAREKQCYLRQAEQELAEEGKND